MNSTQIQSAFGPLLTLLGTLLAAKVPYFDAGTWGQIIGAISALGGVLWTAFTTRGTALITAAANNPEVKSITLEPTASQATVAATPANVVKP